VLNAKQRSKKQAKDKDGSTRILITLLVFRCVCCERELSLTRHAGEREN
jgi:hypothetical protein